MIAEPRLSGKSSATRQRFFVAALLLLGLLISVVVARFVDPPAQTGVAADRSHGPGMEVNPQ